MLLNVITHSLY